MIWPWSKLDFKSKTAKLSRQAIWDLAMRDFPGLKSSSLQLGDWPLYALAEKDLRRMFAELDGLPIEYIKDFHDCENQTRRRMVQVIDYLNDWTNLKKPPAIFEIRGFVPLEAHTGIEGQVGHSMLYAMTAEGKSYLIEPASREYKNVEYVQSPWLIYE